MGLWAFVLVAYAIFALQKIQHRLLLVLLGISAEVNQATLAIALTNRLFMEHVYLYRDTPAWSSPPSLNDNTNHILRN
jgi:hypothetical protein